MVECDLVSEVTSYGDSISGIRIWKATHSIMPIKELNFSRGIFRVDDLVLKFNIEYDDPTRWSQGRDEARLCLRLAPEDYKYFVEVIHTGLVRAKDGSNWRWVAQPYIEEVANPPQLDAETIRVATEKVCKLAAEYRVGDISDRPYPRNWTVVRGEPLIFDYGVVGDGGLP